MIRSIVFVFAVLMAAPAFADPVVMGPFQAAQRMRMEHQATALAQRDAVNPAAPTTTRPVPPVGKKPITKEAAQGNPVLVIQQFTVTDLQAALADAQAQTPPDTTAANCYQALIPIVQTGVGNPFPTGLGGFQLLQKGRDLKAAIANLRSPTGPLSSLNIACAPLVLDTENTLIQLGIVGGAVAVTAGSGGLTLPFTLPFLPKF